MKYDAAEFRECASRWINESKPEEQLINEEYMALRLRVAVDEAERLRVEKQLIKEEMEVLMREMRELQKQINISPNAALTKVHYA